MARRTEVKTLQLCKQVERTLSMVLSGELEDEVLDGLAVISVNAIDGSSLLLVEVALPTDTRGLTADEVHEHLHRAAGLFRREVAAAVRRKRVPQLAFKVITADQGEAETTLERD
jgi:ribosome-binding factor A